MTAIRQDCGPDCVTSKADTHESIACTARSFDGTSLSEPHDRYGYLLRALFFRAPSGWEHLHFTCQSVASGMCDVNPCLSQTPPLAWRGSYHLGFFNRVLLLFIPNSSLLLQPNIIATAFKPPQTTEPLSSQHFSHPSRPTVIMSSQPGMDLYHCLVPTLLYLDRQAHTNTLHR